MTLSDAEEMEISRKVKEEQVAQFHALMDAGKRKEAIELAEEFDWPEEDLDDEINAWVRK